MATVVIVNPNDTAVGVPKGKYHIRYRVGSGDVWQGDSFSLEEGSEAQITLVRVSDGNYGVRPAGGKL